MASVWKKLDTPIMCLAPMEDVTDTVFRRVMMECGKPDLMFTEFVSVDGLCSKGFSFVRHRLDFLPEERPLIAQIWGSDPEYFYNGSKMIADMGFDGIDINMGCPVKKVVKKGLCSALVNNRPLAAEMIQATKEAVGDQLPVSVKIRIGYDKIVTEDWVEFLLRQGVDALSVHGRTTKEMSKVPCHWDEIGKAVKVRDKMGVDTLVIGNGDVLSMDQAREKVSEFGVDGVMIGRGVFQNPWLFGERSDITVQDRVGMLVRHIDLFMETWDRSVVHPADKPYIALRRFFKIYIQGFDGAKELRVRLMGTSSCAEARAMALAYLE